MGKALRDFTVAELDALPVGARFVDRGSWGDPDDVIGCEEYANNWAYSKREDGRWSRGDLTHSGSDAALFLKDWREDPYILEGESSASVERAALPDAREALAPFAAMAQHYSGSDFYDGYIVLQDVVRGHTVTAGDFRRAALALRS